MDTRAISRREAARRVKHFVGGAHRLAITSASMAELLGLVEDECRAVLEALAARGKLRKDAQEFSGPLYCKD